MTMEFKEEFIVFFFFFQKEEFIVKKALHLKYWGKNNKHHKL